MTSLRLVRQIEAPPQLAFDAITTCECIALWWNPDAGPMLLGRLISVGGRYRVRFRTLGGTEHECRGEFLELDPPTRVVMSWRRQSDAEDFIESRIEISLRATPGGTDLFFAHSRIRAFAPS
jgi:uncharacterized protein YndB with AHSA1/START domain